MRCLRPGFAARLLAMSKQETERLGGRFAKLWAAGTTSALGSGLATIATPLYLASRTSDPLIVSAAFGVAWTPWLLFALPGGEEPPVRGEGLVGRRVELSDLPPLGDVPDHHLAVAAEGK